MKNYIGKEKKKKIPVDVVFSFGSFLWTVLISEKMSLRLSFHKLGSEMRLVFLQFIIPGSAVSSQLRPVTGIIRAYDTLEVFFVTC